MFTKSNVYFKFSYRSLHCKNRIIGAKIFNYGQIRSSEIAILLLKPIKQFIVEIK